MKHEYIRLGKCIVGLDGRIRLLDGCLAPRSDVWKNLKERIDASSVPVLVEGKVVGSSGAESLLYALGFSSVHPPHFKSSFHSHSHPRSKFLS